MSQRHRLIILQLFIFCLASLVAFAAGRIVVNEDRATTHRFGVVSAGKTSYNLFQPGTVDDDPNACVGTFSVDLKSTEGRMNLEFAGKLRVSYAGKSWEPTLTGEMVFNPLGQLGGSVLDLTFGRDTVHFGSKNINPIELVFKTYVNGESRTILRSIPGPIEFRRIEKDTYSFTYPLAQSLFGSRLSIVGPELAGQPILQAITPVVKEALPNGTSCESVSSPSLEVSPFVAGLMKLGAAWGINP